MPNSGQQKSPQLTLVLLGESGSGKSASGNTILGKRAFKSKASSMPVTTECVTQTKSIYGIEVRVIDTPDFFDEDLQDQSSHIQKCRELCEGGLCVYLLVIQIGRFTDGERDILKRLETALETRVRDRAIILFTRGDDLTSHIDDYVKITNPQLKQLIERCGGRYQAFSNKSPSFCQRLGVLCCCQQSHHKEEEDPVKELMERTSELLKETDEVENVPGYDAASALLVAVSTK